MSLPIVVLDLNYIQIRLGKEMEATVIARKIYLLWKPKLIHVSHSMLCVAITPKSIIKFSLSNSMSKWIPFSKNNSIFFSLWFCVSLFVMKYNTLIHGSYFSFTFRRDSELCTLPEHSDCTFNSIVTIRKIVLKHWIEVACAVWIRDTKFHFDK